MAKREREKVVVQRRVPRGNEAPADVASLYPKGTPTDESGLPQQGVDIDTKTVRQIGAVDSESARVMKQSRLILARKAKGEWCKWNDEDDAVRFWECANVWNGCMIRIKRVAPGPPDESIPDMPMSMFEGDYGLFKSRIREAYWDGRASTYTWKCYDRTHPQLAAGKLEFSRQRSEDDMNQNRQPPPGGYPYPPQNPYAPPNPYGGGYGGGMPPFNPHMPYGAPFPQQQYQQSMGGQVGATFEQQPPMQQPQPQVQQPVQPQAVVQPQPQFQPVAQGSDPNLVQMLMHLSAQLSQALQQNAYLQQQILALQNQQQQPQVHPVVNANEPQEKVSPISALKESLSNAQEVMKVGKVFAQEFGGGPHEVEEPETKEPETPFPVQVKDVGGVNMIAENGEVVRDFWPNMLVNSGKALAIGSGFFDKIAGIVNKASEAQKKNESEADKAIERATRLAAIDKERADSAERAARARIAMANAPVPQVVVVEAPAQSAPQPVSSEPEAEPFPLGENTKEQAGPPPNGSAST